MRASLEPIIINLKLELSDPFLSDLKCTYLIQKIKLLNSHNESNIKGRETLHDIL